MSDDDDDRCDSPSISGESDFYYDNDQIIRDSASYKKVAKVENFFDIIYGVHVEMEGRGGKHAGQKRTYRAIAATYAFLPREAVTRFLLSCAHCQRRMHSAPSGGSPRYYNKLPDSKHLNVTSRPALLPAEVRNEHLNQTLELVLSLKSPIDDNTESSIPETDSVMTEPDVNMTEPEVNGLILTDRKLDLSLPITTSYMRLQSEAKRNYQDSLSSGDSDLSADLSVSNPPSPKHDACNTTESLPNAVFRDGLLDSPVNIIPNDKEPPPLVMDIGEAKENGHDPTTDVTLSDGRDFPPENGQTRKRRASDEGSVESSTKTSDQLDEGRDDDDDDDVDDEDKLPSKDYDPERLKAFNMFVRLFVDENLDRIVPISKQPKDKVQAILDACNRQFPEFHERARKRIRTYLKSCRRLRRTKEQNGWEQLRPTPPHLTSAAAEGLLAQACDNETQNAKRMRMGMEPLAASAMPPAPPVVITSTITPSSTSTLPTTTDLTPLTLSTPSTHPTLLTTSEFLKAHAPTAPLISSGTTPPISFRPPLDLPAPFFSNGSALFRPAAGYPGAASAAFQHPAHHHTSSSHVLQPQQITQNGPADLTIKKSKNPLTSSEVSTIRSLISGYRESAAFLYRSADELEQLLLQQN